MFIKRAETTAANVWPLRARGKASRSMTYYSTQPVSGNSYGDRGVHIAGLTLAAVFAAMTRWRGGKPLHPRGTVARAGGPANRFDVRSLGRFVA